VSPRCVGEARRVLFEEEPLHVAAAVRDPGEITAQAIE
jgi:hypothetical protein